MAKVVYLEQNQSPPERGDRIEIKPSADKFDTTRWAGNQIAYDNGRWPLEQALQLAQRDADAFGIPTIYVRHA